ncbi:MAG: biotin transporter BioY, partial [Candidatus Kapabacteria bacterium]|nr:biotin transporter BioY [Candidatus Kapabacteria bacterium]
MTTSALGTVDLRNVAFQAAIVVGFAAAIVVGAQISVPLPWTPVPLTGQSLVVVLAGMMLGARRGMAAVATYILAGMAGLPVFANFGNMVSLWGPTSGYLFGFFAAAAAAGFAAERGLTRHWSGAFLTAFFAQLIIIICGAFVLQGFVPFES